MTTLTKANPVDLRKAREICNALEKAGIEYVPIPVFGNKEELTLKLQMALELIKGLSLDEMGGKNGK
jgi:hypothetical protein